MKVLEEVGLGEKLMKELNVARGTRYFMNKKKFKLEHLINGFKKVKGNWILVCLIAFYRNTKMTQTRL